MFALHVVPENWNNAILYFTVSCIRTRSTTIGQRQPICVHLDVLNNVFKLMVNTHLYPTALNERNNFADMQNIIWKREQKMRPCRPCRLYRNAKRKKNHQQLLSYCAVRAIE